LVSVAVLTFEGGVLREPAAIDKATRHRIYHQGRMARNLKENTVRVESSFEQLEIVLTLDIINARLDQYTLATNA
jgi:hypothetical protein